jgi:polyhydroxybutyrate depolymerase
LTHQKGARQVDLQDLVPGIERQLVRVIHPKNSGDVAQHVQLAESLDALLDECGDGVRVGDITDCRLDARARGSALLGGLFQRLSLQVDTQYRRAFAREPLGGRAPNARSGSGYECHTVFETPQRGVCCHLTALPLSGSHDTTRSGEAFATATSYSGAVAPRSRVDARDRADPRYERGLADRPAERDPLERPRRHDVRLGIAAVVLAVWLSPVVSAAEDADCSLAAGSGVETIEVAGRARRYHIAVGSRATAAAPLVFVWHGWGGTAGDMLRVFDPARIWRDAIVVAPEGLPRRCPGLSPMSQPGWQIALGEFEDRDLQLFDAIVELLRRRGCIDPQRVYSTGFSNGGFFSNLLGCQRGEVVAAIAPVSGGGPREGGCSGPVPVMITHGSADDVVSYREGERSFRRWLRQNACGEAGDASATACIAAQDCERDTRFCSFRGGHRWPRGAEERIAEFFREHTR